MIVMKNLKLNQWLWKWHVIAGLICSPFIVLLAITGGIYLFRVDYETPKQTDIIEVEVVGTPSSYQKQLSIANAHIGKDHNAIILPEDKSQATQFTTGRFSHKNSTYINPYTSQVTGNIKASDGIMYKVRKLHGELLLGSFGTKIVELIASWVVVLLITGIFIWWPVRGWKLQGLFIPRFNKGKKILFRDLHAITAFWISGLLLLVLAGGFPWTDIVGNNFKQLQKVTNTGYPLTWMGIGIPTEKTDKTVTLDEIVKKAYALDLPGTITIDFPKGPSGVYSVSNTYYKDLDKQQKVHYSQYSGEVVLHQTWKDVGFLMRGRMWVMAFHQGQFGKWNWWLMLSIAILFAITSLAAIVSYFSKKEKGKWVVPNVPKSFTVSKLVIVSIIILGLLFPLFGISAFLIFIIERFKKKVKIKEEIL